MKKNVEAFPKSDTQIIKGLAILLMLMHHLWFFPDRIAGGKLKYLFTFLGKSSTDVMGSFGKICVSLFFFVGGYGIYIQSKNRSFNILKNIKKIYKNYWKVFLIFIPIGYIFFNNQTPYCLDEKIYNNFLFFGYNYILANFLGLSSSLNAEWWFLKSYIIAIITFPFIKRLFKDKDTVINIFIIIIVTILMCNVFPFLGTIPELGTLSNNYLYTTFLCQNAPYISCFWMGILFAKDDLFKKVIKKINEAIVLNPIVDIIGIMLIVYSREFVVGEIIDILYVPLLIILFLNLIQKLPIIQKIFTFLGDNSTNMWLTHSFFCYYFSKFAKITTYFKWAIPCLIVLLFFSIISSLLIDYFWKGISSIFNKILKRKNSIV